MAAAGDLDPAAVSTLVRGGAGDRRGRVDRPAQQLAVQARGVVGRDRLCARRRRDRGPVHRAHAALRERVSALLSSAADESQRGLAEQARAQTVRLLSMSLRAGIQRALLATYK